MVDTLNLSVRAPLAVAPSPAADVTALVAELVPETAAQHRADGDAEGGEGVEQGGHG